MSELALAEIRSSKVVTHYNLRRIAESGDLAMVKQAQTVLESLYKRSLAIEKDLRKRNCLRKPQS